MVGLVAVVGLGLVACGNTASNIDETSWNFAGYDVGDGPVNVIGDTEPTIAFQSDQVSGSDGCNNFTGTYETDAGNKITVGPLAVTQRACEPPVMEQADVILSIVSDAFLYEKKEGEFFLRTEDAQFAKYVEP